MNQNPKWAFQPPASRHTIRRVLLILHASAFRPSRQLDVEDQPRVRIPRGDASLVQFDGATGDGQAQADAAAGSVSVFLDTVERFEYLTQGIRGNARPVVPYADDREAFAR